MNVRIAKDCPACGAYLRRQNGKRGDFMSCSAYPRCKFAEAIADVEGTMSDMRDEYDYYRDLLELVRSVEKLDGCSSCQRVGAIVNGAWLAGRL